MRTTTFLVAWLPLFAGAAFSAHPQEAQPNVLLFLLDDKALEEAGTRYPVLDGKSLKPHPEID